MQWATVSRFGSSLSEMVLPERGRDILARAVLAGRAASQSAAKENSKIFPIAAPWTLSISDSAENPSHSSLLA